MRQLTFLAYSDGGSSLDSRSAIGAFSAVIALLFICILSQSKHLSPTRNLDTPTSVDPRPAQGSSNSNSTPLGSIRADDLEDELKHPPASEKEGVIVIADKIIVGDLGLDATDPPIGFTLIFRHCRFLGAVDISWTFKRDLEFEDVTLAKNLTLDKARIGGDLTIQGAHAFSAFQLDNRSPRQVSEPLMISLNDAKIAGDLRISDALADKLQFENLNVGNLILNLTGSIRELQLQRLHSSRVSLASPTNSHIDQIVLNDATIQESIVIQHLQIAQLSANRLSARRLELLAPTEITKSLTLESSSLTELLWEFPSPKPLLLPAQITIDGALLGRLEMRAQPDGGDANGNSSCDRPGCSHVDYGLEFINRARYSEPAYAAYEVQLAGQPDRSDAVYFAMRDRRRDLELREASGINKSLAGLDWMLGFGHKWLFGYGRSWIYPFGCWTILLGLNCILFRSAHRMERVLKVARPYSRLWYSVDLLVPILNLETSKSWRPKASESFLLFYSNLSAALGLIFISALVGALTGALK